jgi:hypothetical protein
MMTTYCASDNLRAQTRSKVRAAGEYTVQAGSRKKTSIRQQFRVDSGSKEKKGYRGAKQWSTADEKHISQVGKLQVMFSSLCKG